MKNLLFKVTRENSMALELSLLLPRVFIGLTMALTHGLGKVPPPDALIGGVEGMGFPAPVVFAWLAGLSEFLGGLFIALGFFTRPSAIFLGFTMLVAAFVAHGADPFGTKELSLMYFFMTLIFMIRGGGKLSVDALINK